MGKEKVVVIVHCVCRNCGTQSSFRKENYKRTELCPECGRRLTPNGKKKVKIHE